MNEPIKGKEYLCIKTVVMSSGYTAYIKGKVYISEQNRCITNEKNNANHIWTKKEMNECFTEIKETYEITKETILKYKIKDEFPEVFEVKLEVGKWYKSDMGGIWFLEDLLRNGQQMSYGINCLGKWSDSDVRNSINLIEATKQEVFEALKNEAVKRGFKEGVYFKSIDYDTDEVLKIESIGFCIDKNSIHLRTNSKRYTYRDIFDSGIWAEIIPTKTKEEAEKLLNCKIIS